MGYVFIPGWNQYITFSFTGMELVYFLSQRLCLRRNSYAAHKIYKISGSKNYSKT